jgi:cyclic-di-GMP-binding protein
MKAMPATYSFDVTSNIEMPEVDNAINQARKEIGQRFDFKGSIAAIELDQKANTLTLTAEDNFKLESVWDVLQTRLIKRNVPVKNMKRGDIEMAAGSTVRQVITLQQGIPADAARDIVKHLKDLKLKKVQAQIQGEQLRVTSPSKDELQGAMQALRAKDFGVALQFGNYR